MTLVVGASRTPPLDSAASATLSTSISTTRSVHAEFFQWEHPVVYPHYACTLLCVVLFAALFHDYPLTHNRIMLKGRKKQTSLDRSILKLPAGESEVSVFKKASVSNGEAED